MTPIWDWLHRLTDTGCGHEGSSDRYGLSCNCLLYDNRSCPYYFNNFGQSVNKDSSHCHLGVSGSSLLFSIFDSFCMDYIHHIYTIIFCLFLFCPYPNLICLLVLVLEIHSQFPCRTTGGNIRLIWIHCISQACLQAIVRYRSWPSQRAIPCRLLGCGSNVGCIAVVVACLCCVELVPKFNAHCSPLRRGWIWEESIGSGAAIWWAAPTHPPHVACRLVSSS